ncbi:hypothetical protein [Pontimicrobium aquaticum]|uniref:Uncharacterized protein n=1 Tax=Pontimicrobium aquaticum TaxID=2565367 RepID=A0A4U0EP42_9FLAO|nr:hypothetical protein [Pontimicrobium aquaticum]TJY33386.1 hypothetical protein E5167_12865 [Pontimicrobium aquaticum]
MEIYNATAKTKSGELRVTKGIGALLITSSRKVSELVNEKITVFVERQDGNVKILNKVLLKDFILASTFADGLVAGDTANSVGLSALCEIAKFVNMQTGESSGGAIPLAGDEVIIVELTDLVSAQTYTVNGIEYPQIANAFVSSERKTINSDETVRELIVQHRNVMVLGSKSVLESIDMRFSNGRNVTYTKKEIEAISNDVEGIFGFDIDGTVYSDAGSSLVIPLVEVDSIQIEKTAGTSMELTLMSV